MTAISVAARPPSRPASRSLAVIVVLALPLILSLARQATATRPEPTPCSDYEMLVVNSRQCVSRCPIRCVDGVCFEDGACPCDGFYRTSFRRGLVCALACQPGCRSAGGFCASPDVCVCPKGLVFDAVARRCRPHLPLLDRCRGQCLYGRCSADGECVCGQGFQRQETLLGQLCRPVCKQDCGPHGFCHLPNMCACRKGHLHYGPDGRCHHDPEYF